jgi:hypothetical protein
MKNIVIPLVLLFVGCNVLAQTNTLYYEIQQAKQSNIEFKNISVFNEAKADRIIFNEFINPDEVAFFELKSTEIETNDQAINMVIPYKAKNITLELIKVPDFYMDYEVSNVRWENHACKQRYQTLSWNNKRNRKQFSRNYNV